MANLVKLFITFETTTYSRLIRVSSKFPFIIGRQSPDLRINDPEVSRKHCQLTVEMRGLYVEDLNSSNGVDLNGGKVKRSRVVIDDVIKIGNTRIKFLQINLTENKGGKS